MGEVVSLMVAGFIGAFVGYIVRWAEFRRDQRLKVYGEFLRGLLDVARTGADLQSICVSLGPPSEVIDSEQRALYKEAFAVHQLHRAAFEESLARLRLIASKRVHHQAEVVEGWVAQNVHGAPPFTPGVTFSPGATVAKVASGQVLIEASALASAFAHAASWDVAGRLVPRRRSAPR